MNSSQVGSDKDNIRLSVNYSPVFNKCFLITSDILSFIISVFFGYVFSFSHDLYFDGYINPSVIARIGVFSAVMSLTLIWFWAAKRHYSYRKPFWDELLESYSTLSIMALLDLAIISFVKWDYLPLTWFIMWSSMFVVLPLFRSISKSTLDHVGCWKMPSIIIGDSKNAREAYLAIQSEPSTGFRVDAFVIPKENVHEGYIIDGIPCISEEEYFNTKDLLNSKVFIALEKNQNSLRDKWIRNLSKHRVSNISLVPDMRGVPLSGMDVSHFFSHEVMMLRIKNNLARKSSRLIKRLFDIITSSLLLLLLSPLFAFIWFKVTRDGGSATYGHERIGLNGESFKCLKFRSMIMNSKEVLEQLLATDPVVKSEWDKEFKLKNDPRVTQIGSFLRQTSLDELPQLWNVLKGEMSLVGPRPVIDEELERYKEDVTYYLMAKPGMSGLWQVSGRSDTDYDTRVYLDAWYVKNWSLWTDIVILFKTVRVVLQRDGAY